MELPGRNLRVMPQRCKNLLRLTLLISSVSPVITTISSFIATVHPLYRLGLTWAKPLDVRG
jgi:hypothetical protein